VPIAEETGLIVPIGEWVLRRALTEAGRWPRHIRVAVNMSPVQFNMRNLAQVVTNALAASGVEPNRLELEITESLLLQNSNATLATLHQLRDIGVRIALDDFGTGFSSLSYLRSFPFDKIKIDRCFIEGLGEGNEESLAIVRAVSRLGASLGIATAAEGVEAQAQADIVRREGFTEIQGYWLAEPKPASAIVRDFEPQPKPRKREQSKAEAGGGNVDLPVARAQRQRRTKSARSD
jgi:EAL domain-containing protein (putative c-di-GMP-specific phosphodiesterase class I)